MSKKSTHPDRQFFDYLGGRLDETARRAVESHLAECPACATLAEMSKALRGASTEDHPEVSELAAFYYAEPPTARRAAIAAHVAVCAACAEELAAYARAEQAAAAYRPAERQAVPAAAWRMIEEWEDSHFARLKEPAQAVSHELLDRLMKLLGERQERIAEMARQVTAGQSHTADSIPVVIVTRAGELRGVELFEKSADAEGGEVLTHASHSARFDNKPLHALLDFGGRDRVVVSEVIHKDTTRLKEPRPNATPRRADYFIIED